jgi:hypothetical protein
MKDKTASLFDLPMCQEAPPPLTPELVKLKAAVDTLANQIGRSWYSIGLLYHDAVKRKTWQGSAYRNIDVFWINNIASVDLREVRRYAKAAAIYSPDIVAYGIAELDLYISWAHIKRIKLGEDPGPQIVTWTLNGVDYQKPFSQCTQKDLRNAIATVRKHPGHGGAPPAGKAPLSDLLQACMAYVTPRVDRVLSDDPTHDFHAWVDTDVDEEGKEEVLLRADAFTFFDACLKIGEAAKEFLASVGPDGKPRTPMKRALRRSAKPRAR